MPDPLDTPAKTTAFYALMREATLHLRRLQLAVLKASGTHGGRSPPVSQSAHSLIMRLVDEMGAWVRLRQEAEIKSRTTFTCYTCHKVKAARQREPSSHHTLEVPFICRHCADERNP